MVLANPGSAEPLEKLDDAELLNVKNFYDNFECRELNLSNWHKFSEDATMQRVAKIFNGWYIDADNLINLNGVIQLFNTFNVKNQNLSEAVEKLPPENFLLYSIGVEKFFNDKPTYFGFSGDVLNDEKLKDVAEQIFLNSSNNVRSLYYSDFDKNSFYHPTYINRANKQPHFVNYKDNMLKKLLEQVKKELNGK